MPDTLELPTGFKVIGHEVPLGFKVVGREDDEPDLPDGFKVVGSERLPDQRVPMPPAPQTSPILDTLGALVNPENDRLGVAQRPGLIAKQVARQQDTDVPLAAPPVAPPPSYLDQQRATFARQQAMLQQQPQVSEQAGPSFAQGMKENALAPIRAVPEAGIQLLQTAQSMPGSVFATPDAPQIAQQSRQTVNQFIPAPETPVAKVIEDVGAATIASAPFLYAAGPAGIPAGAGARTIAAARRLGAGPRVAGAAGGVAGAAADVAQFTAAHAASQNQNVGEALGELGKSAGRLVTGQGEVGDYVNGIFAALGAVRGVKDVIARQKQLRSMADDVVKTVGPEKAVEIRNRVAGSRDPAAPEVVKAFDDAMGLKTTPGGAEPPSNQLPAPKVEPPAAAPQPVVGPRPPATQPVKAGTPIFHATTANFEGLPKLTAGPRGPFPYEPNGIFYNISEDGAKQATGVQGDQRVVRGTLNTSKVLSVTDPSDPAYSKIASQAMDSVLRADPGILDVQKGNRADAEQMVESFYPQRLSKTITELLKLSGYDAVHFTGNGDVVVLNPNAVNQPRPPAPVAPATQQPGFMRAGKVTPAVTRPPAPGPTPATQPPAQPPQAPAAAPPAPEIRTGGQAPAPKRAPNLPASLKGKELFSFGPGDIRLRKGEHFTSGGRRRRYLPGPMADQFVMVPKQATAIIEQAKALTDEVIPLQGSHGRGKVLIPKDVIRELQAKGLNVGKELQQASAAARQAKVDRETKLKTTLTKGRVLAEMRRQLNLPDATTAEVIAAAKQSDEPQNILYTELYESMKHGKTFQSAEPAELPSGTKIKLGDHTFTVSREYDPITGREETVIANDVTVPVERGTKVPADEVILPPSSKAGGAITGSQEGLPGMVNPTPLTAKKPGKLFETRTEEELPQPIKPLDEADKEFRRGQTPKDTETADLFPESKAAEPGKSMFDDLTKDESGSVAVKDILNVVTKPAKWTYRFVNGIAGQMVNTIRPSRAGRFLGAALDDISSKASTLVGKIENQAVDAYKGLTRADRRWLDAVDSRGYANSQRLIEDTGSGKIAAPNPRIKAWADAYQNMLDVTGDEAVAKGIEKLQGGKVVPFGKAEGGRFLRLPTPDAFQAAHVESGRLYDAIIRTIVQENPGFTPEQAKDFIRQSYGPESVRRVGSLEETRGIKNLPTHVELTPGKGDWVAILEHDPLMSIMGPAEHQARRIYFAERFGQGLLGKPTLIDKLRLRHARDADAKGESSSAADKDFDAVLAVFHRRPWGRIPGDPRAWWRRTGRVINSIIASAQTSASVLPNIPQTMMTASTVGARAWAKGLVQAVMHPRMTAAQMAAMGAAHRSVMEWTIRRGHIPEDITRIITGATSRITGIHWLAQLNNLIAGAQGRAYVDGLRKFGATPADAAVLKDLRLSVGEIKRVMSGNITPEIEKKLVQNVVKITQFITEDPHRRSLLQNVPFLNAVFSYNSYMIGTAKQTARHVNGLFQAIASGNPKASASASWRLLVYIASVLGAGGVAYAMMRASKGQNPIPQDADEAKKAVADIVFESQVLGPAQRALDASRFGGNDGSDWITSISPKFKLLSDVIEMAAGYGPKGQFPLKDRAIDMARKNMSAWNRIRQLIDNASASHSMTDYHRIHRKVAEFEEETGKGRTVGDYQMNPEYWPIRHAIRFGHWDEAKQEVTEYLKQHPKDRKEAINRLRASLVHDRPVNLSEERRYVFLKTLDEDTRAMVTKFQREFEKNLDKILPDMSSSRPAPPTPPKAPTGPKR